MGGFSGVYYDAHKKELYAITDETGKFKGNTIPNPHQFLSIKPKFFRFKIILVNDSDKLNFKLSPIETVFLFDDETSQVSDNTLDPEAFSCQKETCLLCSEPPTDKASSKNIFTLNKDGVLQDLYHIPSYFTPNARKKTGFEKNGGFEACSFIPDEHDKIVAINEKPLLQDGFCKYPSFLRFTIFSLEKEENTREGLAKCLASFPYVISPIESQLTQNLKKLTQGISEVLAMGDGIFLVVERSYITYEHNKESLSVSRIFKVDLHDNLYASNLCTHPHYSIFLSFSKQAANSLKHLKKEPFLNFMNFLNINDGFESVSLNIEGLTKGPCYNGKATLITVNDNNFDTEVDTVFYIFLMIDSSC